MKGGKGAAAAVVLLVFYGSILTIMCVSGSHVLSSIQEQAKKLPGIYSQTIEPGLSHFFSLLENSFPGHSIHISALGQSLEHFMKNVSMGISSALLGWGASAISGIPSDVYKRQILSLLRKTGCHPGNRLRTPSGNSSGAFKGNSESWTGQRFFHPRCTVYQPL